MHPRGPGMFCWLDLKTHDVGATVTLLAESLGWRPAEPQALRAAAVLAHDGHVVAGLSDLSHPVYPPGTPEHIAWYLAVDDVEARTRAALDAGARLVVEPFELPGVGAMSTLLDPLGAAVSLWEQRGFAGWTHAPGTPATPGAPHHRGGDPDAARDFYRRALGLDDPGVRFGPGDDDGTWVPRINGLTEALLTPGGVTLPPSGAA
ncbi:VOC family protein [Streptomyces sp. NPDC093252]|uniref:VOC family protein n=1 Tax=Streptomyces sp. NPDC093252 TaxID=3154980 RepID=UPI003435D280